MTYRCGVVIVKAMEVGGVQQLRLERREVSFQALNHVSLTV